MITMQILESAHGRLVELDTFQNPSDVIFQRLDLFRSDEIFYGHVAILQIELDFLRRDAHRGRSVIANGDKESAF